MSNNYILFLLINETIGDANNEFILIWYLITYYLFLKRFKSVL